MATAEKILTLRCGASSDFLEADNTTCDFFSIFAFFDTEVGVGCLRFFAMLTV